MTDRETLRDQWRTVAKALSIEFVAPFVLTLPDGRQREFAGLLPQFGNSHGMLIDTEYEKDAFTSAIASGFACSSMSAESHYLPVDPANYIDCLKDWGWSGEGQAPGWYLSAV